LEWQLIDHPNPDDLFHLLELVLGDFVKPQHLLLLKELAAVWGYKGGLSVKFLCVYITLHWLLAFITEFAVNYYPN